MKNLGLLAVLAALILPACEAANAPDKIPPEPGTNRSTTMKYDCTFSVEGPRTVPRTKKTVVVSTGIENQLIATVKDSAGAQWFLTATETVGTLRLELTTSSDAFAGLEVEAPLGTQSISSSSSDGVIARLDCLKL